MKKELRNVVFSIVSIGLSLFAVWYANGFYQRWQAEQKEIEAMKVQEAKEYNARWKADRAAEARAEKQTVETGVAFP